MRLRLKVTPAPPIRDTLPARLVELSVVGAAVPSGARGDPGRGAARRGRRATESVSRPSRRKGATAGPQIRRSASAVPSTATATATQSAIASGYLQNGYIRPALYLARMSRVNNPAKVTQAGFLVLLALAIDEAHGYAVMQFAEEATGGRVRLPPGTLYRTISGLVAAGLVEEIEGEDPDAPHDARRRYYRLTKKGAQAAEDEVELLARLFRAASRAGLASRATKGDVGDAGLAVGSVAETLQGVAPEFPPKILHESLGASRTSEELPRMTMGPWRRRARATFRREGEYWSIAFSSDAFRLRDSKGLRHLSVLLAAPGREFHSLELVVTARGHARPEGHGPAELSSGTGDAGEILDERAKTEYRNRLRDLESELAEAENWNDSERAARLREEIDFLARELGAAVGLGGRDRRAASNAERARVNVTRAIKAALERIAEHSPTLGRHLSVTIRTGTFCAYQPDPRVPVTWSS